MNELTNQSINQSINGSCPQDASRTYTEIRKITPSNVKLVAVMSGMKKRCMLSTECANRIWRGLHQTGILKSLKHHEAHRGQSQTGLELMQQMEALGLRPKNHRTPLKSFQRKITYRMFILEITFWPPCGVEGK